jgi:hypothetical protein
VRVDETDRVIHVVDGAVDVSERALLQALRKAVIFFMRDVLAGLVQKLARTMQTAGVIQAGINRRMIVQVFAIVDRSSLDLRDGVIDRVDRFFFLVPQFAASMNIQVGASRAKIRQSVQIGRMLSLSGRIASAKRQEQSKKQHCERDCGDGLPRHSFSF